MSGPAGRFDPYSDYEVSNKNFFCSTSNAFCLDQDDMFDQNADDYPYGSDEEDEHLTSTSAR